jgi:hypothetical protein
VAEGKAEAMEAEALDHYHPHHPVARKGVGMAELEVVVEAVVLANLRPSETPYAQS